MSAPKIDQKEYLKRYLAKDPSKKRKKKPKDVKGKSITIIDSNVDVDRLEKFNDDELEVYQDGDDAPQVVGVIDDRPAELRALDFKNNSRWKVIADDNGFDSDLIVQEMDSEGRIRKNVKKVESKNKQKSVSFGGPRDDDSDVSPPRRGERSADVSPARKSTNKSPEARPKRRDSDASPPRGKRTGSDASPPRRSRKDSDTSPPRRSRKDSDNSPPRQKRASPDRSPVRRTRKADSDDDLSPVRKRDRGSPDHSPPRRRAASPRSTRDRSRSPMQNTRRRSEDRSPPRRHRNSSRDSSPPRRSRHRPSPDKSPARRRERPCPSRSHSHRDRRSPPNDKRREKRRWDSPPSAQRDQRRGSPSSSHPKRRPQETSHTPPPLSSNGKRMEKTLDGKMAGLQSAKALRVETEKFREREKKVFDGMDEDMCGKNAQVVRRDRKTGRIRDMEAEMEREREKDEKDRERKAVYDHWGKGVKQVEDHRKRHEEEQIEMSKPVARYAGDADLEDYLRKQERDGDPMLAYMREKEKERRFGSGKVMMMPKYQGSYALNRFNIAPGYRWDGVDRSNGYEKKYFDVQSSKKAGQEEAYRYSTEDM